MELTRRNLTLFNNISDRRTRIMQPSRSNQPSNIQEISERVVSRSRRSASPPESEYMRSWKKANLKTNKTTMVIGQAPLLLKNYDDDDSYHQVFFREFTGFSRHDCGGLSAPAPDFVEGLEMGAFEQLRKRDRKRIRGAVAYRDDLHSLVLPHLVGEWTGPSGEDLRETQLRAGHDGAALVFARTQALAFIGAADPPNHAAVVSFTTDGSTLHLFAHFADRLASNTYHQFPIASVHLHRSFHDFKRGRALLRSLQDYAREQVLALRDRITAHYQLMQPNLSLYRSRAVLPPQLIRLIAQSRAEDANPVKGIVENATKADEAEQQVDTPCVIQSDGLLPTTESHDLDPDTEVDVNPVERDFDGTDKGNDLTCELPHFGDDPV